MSVTIALNDCPFCGKQPYPIQDILVEQKFVGRKLECRCGVFLYRHQCYTDDSLMAVETPKTLDADLARRWNTRAQMSEISSLDDGHFKRIIETAIYFTDEHGQHDDFSKHAAAVFEALMPYLCVTVPESETGIPATEQTQAVIQREIKHADEGLLEVIRVAANNAGASLTHRMAEKAALAAFQYLRTPARESVDAEPVDLSKAKVGDIVHFRHGGKMPIGNIDVQEVESHHGTNKAYFLRVGKSPYSEAIGNFSVNGINERFPHVGALCEIVRIENGASQCQ